MEIIATKIEFDIDNNLYEEILNELPRDKVDRIKRFRRIEDSMRTLAADLLIRTAACIRFNTQNRFLKFQKGCKGKPYLLNNKDFHFNLSHSGDFAVCAISNKTIGIDIEKVQDMDFSIAKRFFSQSETQDLFSKDGEARKQYFFDLWTLKESYIKADGRGMFLPLNSFSFGIKDNIITFKTENKLRDCFFKIYTIADQYKISVCTLEDTFPQTVTIKNFYDIIELFLGSK
ncbi:MAG: 4'-phosphopantetheinyl transferase superfamily protein [Clostridium sp.]|nr:4'-phosphopantetheinyl transferase superfamily protein [Clostridium sp.]